MKISILIATCSRAANLRDFLESIPSWVIPEGTDFEVCVIDNNSKDSTRELVESFARLHPGRVRYFFEGRQGKSYALNQGLREACGDILVITDDDCIPDRHWLAAIAKEFSSRPELGFLGGRIELYNPADKPVTIRLSRERQILTSPADLFFFIAGCNMAFRRDVVRAIGEFDVTMGPGSRAGAVVEDVDFIYRAFRAGFRVEYTPEIVVYHNHGRRSDSDVQNLNRRYVIGRGAFYGKYIVRGDVQVLKAAYWETRKLLRYLVRSLFAGKGCGEGGTFLWLLFKGAAGNWASRKP